MFSGMFGAFGFDSEEETKKNEEMKREAELRKKYEENLDKMPKEEGKPESEFIGAVGDKLSQVVTFVRYFEYERNSYSGWGKELARIYKFVDDSGNVLIWNTSSWKNLQEGTKYTIKG